MFANSHDTHQSKKQYWSLGPLSFLPSLTLLFLVRQMPIFRKGGGKSAQLPLFPSLLGLTFSLANKEISSILPFFGLNSHSSHRGKRESGGIITSDAALLVKTCQVHHSGMEGARGASKEEELEIMRAAETADEEHKNHTPVLLLLVAPPKAASPPHPQNNNNKKTKNTNLQKLKGLWWCVGACEERVYMHV